MLTTLLRFYRDDQAVSAAEYAVLLALILVAIISAITAVGDSTHGIWANDASQIEAAVSGS
jgi:pilus assembly protein Flp/PilA